MREKNIKKVIIDVKERVGLNFTDILLIVTIFGVIFFIGMFSTVMSNWQIILTSILLCYLIHCTISMLNNKLAQVYCEGAMDTIEVLKEYERKL